VHLTVHLVRHPTQVHRCTDIVKTIVEELLGLLTEAGEAIEPGGSKSPTFA